MCQSEYKPFCILCGQCAENQEKGEQEMRGFMFTMLMLVMLTLYAVTCFAADAAPAANVWGDSLVTFLTNTVFPIFGALTLGFITWACQKVGAKYKIDSLLGNNTFVTQLAKQGIAFAEEKAANFAKTSTPITSNDKLNAAMAYVMQMAPKVSDAQAQSLVTSALAMLPGVGATGATAVGVAAPPA